MKPGVSRKKIVALLVDKYIPVESSVPVQMQLVLDMLRDHETVHRPFFLDAYPHVGMSSSCKSVGSSDCVKPNILNLLVRIAGFSFKIYPYFDFYKHQDYDSLSFDIAIKLQN